jgi:putative Holliday junction resolvase
MRIMALDVGKKRIGVAVSDELQLTGQSLTTIEHTGYKADREAIRRLVQEYQVGEIVIGLPRHMNGSVGDWAEEILKFGAKLQASLGVKVTFWDERLSTVAAERVLLEGDTGRRRRRQVIDRVAATWFLSGYLESRRKRDEQGE